MDKLIGKSFGPYRVLEKVHEGGMTIVCKAYQASLDRYVAVKVLQPELARDEELATRFRREALAVAQLNHPNILHVYDAGVAHAMYYIVMGFVDGGSLKDLIGQGPLDSAYAVSIGAQLADALDYAHKQGIVHRNVKPSNVLMTRDGRPMLTDFGVAKAFYESAALTQTGASIGTPEYMAPEQIQGQPVDGRTDIYALGIVVYEMLTGRTPFSTPTAVETLYKQVNELPPPLDQANVNVPDWLEGVVGRALAKRPEGRYQRAAEMAKALRSRDMAGKAAPTAQPVAPTPIPIVSAEPITVSPEGGVTGGDAAPPKGPVGSQPIQVDPDNPPIAAIRELLEAAFTPQKLHGFCQDRPQFRDLIHHFGPGHGLDDMVGEVIDYCRTQLLWDELLAEVAVVNRKQYDRFEPRLRAAATTPAAPRLEPVSPASAPIPTVDRAALRRRLDQTFDDPGLDAFCLDYFPEVYDRFSRGMRKDEKMTLLLDHCRRDAGELERLAELTSR